MINEAAVCQNFSVGNPRLQEFYSPGYPGKYPAKVDCILVLRAEYGYIIRVDFRDQFEVEDSAKCDYDFLEIRDGAHGYSPLGVKLCGRQFPKSILSNDSFLWLRFSSDDTIEYAGFRAVYQFIPDLALNKPDKGLCQFEKRGLDGVFSSKDIPEEVLNYTFSYQAPLDCTWLITVDIAQKIQLSFPQYALMAPNECENNYIEVFGEKTDLNHRLRQFCGSAVDIVTSKTNILHVRFYATPKYIKSSFEAIFTAFKPYRDTEVTNKCLPSEFDCDDATCIDRSLRCNDRPNCKFRYDEDNCKDRKASFITSVHIIIILTIGCLLMFGMCFTCFYNCFRKLRADHHEYQARRSRSREDRLDVIDDRPGSGIGRKLPLSNNRVAVSRGKTEEDDDPFDQRMQSSTSRSLSSPVDNMANGFVESIKLLERNMPSKTEVDVYVDRRQEDNDEEYSDGESDVDEDVESVEMVDHACQTRESLFSNRDSRTSSDPIKAHYPMIYRPTQNLMGGGNISKGIHASSAPDNNVFKAETVIEISRKKHPRTDSSTASSKSGPDVVILH